ncbi:lamin tail domain-containing protein [Candidatus Woesearchaeota archaeon]|nr:lamin tail domain-containing protein [Candidatus Woesearchaeota archaeon]
MRCWANLVLKIASKCLFIVMALFFACMFFVFTTHDCQVFANPVNVSVSEIFYNPLGSDYCCEFLEVYTANKSVNLESWIVGDASSNDTLRALQFTNSSVSLIVPESFNYSGLTCNVYSAGSRIGNGLGNNGDVVKLYDPNGSLVFNISYNNNALEGESLQLVIDKDFWISSLPTPCSLSFYNQYFDVGLKLENNMYNLNVSNAELVTNVEVPIFKLVANSITNFSIAPVNVSVCYNLSLVNLATNSSNLDETFHEALKLVFINDSSRNYSTSITLNISFNNNSLGFYNNSFNVNVKELNASRLNFTIKVCSYLRIEGYEFDRNVSNNNACSLIRIEFQFFNVSNNDTANDSQNLDVCRNATVLLLLNNDLLRIGSSLKFKPLISNAGENCSFLIQYWVEDLNGCIVKAKRNTSNTDWKSFTPKESLFGDIDRAFIVKAELFYNNSLISNDSALAVFFNPSFEDSTSNSEEKQFQSVESNVSVTSIVEDGKFKINLHAFKGDTGKKLVLLKILCENQAFTVFKTYLNTKQSSVDQYFEIPLQSLQECSSNFYNVTVKGLGFSFSKVLNNTYKFGIVKSLTLSYNGSLNVFANLALRNLEVPVLELRLYKNKRLKEKQVLELNNNCKQVVSVFNVTEGFYSVKAILTDGKVLSMLQANISIPSQECFCKNASINADKLFQEKILMQEQSKRDDNQALVKTSGMVVLDLQSKNKKLLLSITSLFLIVVLVYYSLKLLGKKFGKFKKIKKF